MESTKRFKELVSNLGWKETSETKDFIASKSKIIVLNVINQGNIVNLNIFDCFKRIDQFSGMIYNLKNVNENKEVENLSKKIENDINFILNTTEELQKTIMDHNFMSKDANLCVACVIKILVEEQRTLSQQYSRVNIEYLKKIVFEKSSLSQIISVQKNNKNEVFFSDSDEESLELEEELRKELELENKEMELDLENYLSSTHKVEKQVEEVSELLNVFNTKVSEQREIMTSIYDDISNSVINVEKGNEELKKTDNRAKNDIQLFLFYLIGSILLIIYDY